MFNPSRPDLRKRAVSRDDGLLRKGLLACPGERLGCMVLVREQNLQSHVARCVKAVLAQEENVRSTLMVYESDAFFLLLADFSGALPRLRCKPVTWRTFKLK